MVARTQPTHGALIVVFTRDGDEPESLFAHTVQEAWGHALHLIAKRSSLQAGDTLQVLDAAGDPEQLPEVSRAAHYS
jgi:hypothetical protein